MRDDWYLIIKGPGRNAPTIQYRTNLVPRVGEMVVYYTIDDDNEPEMKTLRQGICQSVKWDYSAYEVTAIVGKEAHGG